MSEKENNNEKKVIKPEQFQKLPGATDSTPDSAPGFRQPKKANKLEKIEMLERQIKGYQQILQSIAKKQYEMENAFNQNFLQYDVISLALRNVIKELGVTEEQWNKSMQDSANLVKLQQEEKFDEKHGFNTVNREAKKGDFIAIAFVGKIDDKEFKGGTCHFQIVEIGKNQFLSQIEDSLVDKKKDDIYKVDVQFPADYQVPDLRNQNAIFEIKVLAVKEKKESKTNNETKQ